MCSRVSVRGSASPPALPAVERVTRRTCSPGPTAPELTAKRPRAPPFLSASRRIPTRFPPSIASMTTLSAAAPPVACTSSSSGIESPAVTRAGPLTRVSARSGRDARGKSRTPTDWRRSGGMSPASSISPSVTTRTDRSDADAAVSAGASSERPRVGSVSADPRSSPKRRTSPHWAAESRASRQRPPGAVRLSEASSSTNGRWSLPATGQLTLRSRRPSAPQATARQASGTHPRGPVRSSRR